MIFQGKTVASKRELCTPDRAANRSGRREKVTLGIVNSNRIELPALNADSMAIQTAMGVGG
jgi:hypothetical protein